MRRITDTLIRTRMPGSCLLAAGILTVALGAPATHGATNYYVNDVDQTDDVYTTEPGHADNDGLSPDAPRLDLASIFDDYDIGPGDTIHVDTGSYALTAGVTIEDGDEGADGDPVTVVGSPNGTVLDRQGGDRVFHLNGSYVTLELLTLTGASDGVRMDYPASGQAIRRCTIHGNARGIYIYGSSNVLIESNLIYGVTSDGINVASTYIPDGVQIIANTIVADGEADGIDHNVNTPTATVTIRDNVISVDGTGSCIEVSSDGSNLTSDHNCLYAQGSAPIGTSSSGTHSGIGDWQAALGVDLHSLSVNPAFVDAGNDDYHLAASSPAIDAADSASPFANEPPPNGDRRNLGAYGNTTDATTSPSDRSLRVLSPTQGGLFDGDVLITWLAQGTDWDPADTVLVEYSPDSGANWSTVTGGAAVAYDGELLWDTSGLCGGFFLVRVTWNEGGGVAATGEPFTIMTACPGLYYVNDADLTDDVYTAAIGSDANDGLSPASPRLSLKSIVDDYPLEPGQTVYVDTGSYSVTETIVISESDQGADGDPVTVIGTPAGSVLDRQGGDRVFLVEASHIALEQLTLTGATDAVRTEYTATGNVIRGCTLRGNTRGIYVFGGSNMLIESNLIHDVTDDGIYLSSSHNPDNMQIISNTIVADGGDDGIDHNATSPIATLIVRDNIITADGSGTCIELSSDGSSLTSDTNCLFASGGAAVGSSSAGTHATIGNWQADLGLDKHSLGVDPQFVDAANDDYHLGAASPCIDAADAASAFAVEPAPNGDRRNLGDYGNTSEATTSPADRSLALLSPAAGGHFDGDILITWSAQGTNWEPPDTLLVEYSSDNGSNWSTVPGGVTVAYDGELLWDTSGLCAGSFQVRVTWNEGVGVSDTGGTFTILTACPGLYYVNDTSQTDDVYTTVIGDDANDGLAPDRPRLSVKSIFDDYNVEPGQTVYVDTGTYALDEDIVIEEVDEGSDGDPVTVVGSPEGTLIDRQGGTRAFYLLGSYITLEQLVITGGNADGVRTYYTASNHVVRRCTLHGNEIGIYVYGSSDILIENNLIYDVTVDGIHLASSYTTVGAQIISNTIVADGADDGIDHDSASNSATVTISHNVISVDGAGRCIELSTDGSNLTSNHNCLFTQGGAVVGQTSAGIFTTLPEWQATGQDADSIDDDPTFENAPGGDYHLVDSSRCIDSGDNGYTPSAGLTDIDGEDRIMGCRVDLGADESTTLRTARADLDDDCDVDDDDKVIFESCASGPTMPHNGTPICQRADFDDDTDVDQRDLAVFQRCYSDEDVDADADCAN